MAIIAVNFYLNENNISEISNLIEYLKDKGDRRITVNLTDNPIKKLPENYLDINFHHVCELYLER